MLSKTEERELVLLLKKLEPGYYPIDIFHNFCRLWTTVAVEFIPFKLENGKLKVILIKRQETDKFFPGFWHSSGSCVRPTDTIETTFKRILESELGYFGDCTPVFVKNVLHKSVRGNGLGLLYWGILEEKCKKGKEFFVDNLPKDFLPIQQQFIDNAVQDYKQKL